MRSIVLPAFRKMLERLPSNIQTDARAGFEKWKTDPRAVGWKRLHGTRAELHSVQVGLKHRAIGVVDKTNDVVIWMFVGSHETYNNWIDIHRQMAGAHWTGDRQVTGPLQQRRNKQPERTAASAQASLRKFG